jgi:hypothetical protein
LQQAREVADFAYYAAGGTAVRFLVELEPDTTFLQSVAGAAPPRTVRKSP